MAFYDILLAKQLAGSGGGGGGGGDFSTATVTITVSGPISFDNCPVLVSEAEFGINACMGAYMPQSEVSIVTVPLYKGSCIWMSPVDGSRVSVTGAITAMGTGAFVIMGDGTITIS